ncbi:MAG: DnaA/Hda family protein [Phycisphaeraceae bacterium]
MTATDTVAIDIPARIASLLAEEVGPRKFTMWFEGEERFAFDPENNQVRVYAPHRFAADWIRQNFSGTLDRIVSEVVGPETSVDVPVDSDRFRTEPSSSDMARPPQAERAAAGGKTPARPVCRGPVLRHRLDQFIVGPSNELAYAAATRLAEAEGNEFGPLFVHGSCGLGKTHLLQGICQRVLELDPGASVVYTTGEQFTNEFITAIRSNKIDAFRKRVRRLTLLAIDDVHFLADKQATQEEFLHSFEQIELAGARVIMASDSHPRTIHRFSEALRSRCVRGLVAQVMPPDDSTRARLIGRLAERLDLRLTDEAVSRLLERWNGSVRDLEGLLRKVQATLMIAALRHEPVGGGVDGAIIDRALSDERMNTRKRPVRFDEIVAEVEKVSGITRAQIVSSSRKPAVVIARSVCIALVREMTTLSYPEIASAMGKENHSTVVTACKRVPRLLREGKPSRYPSTAEEITPRQFMDRVRGALS